MIALARTMSRGVARFAKARSGLAAVEFAMLLPIMMTLYLGCVEITTAVATQRKVTLTARALADLPSQFTAVTNADMTNILNAASDIIAPYTAAKLKSVVSELAIDANGQATVVWSDTLNGTARTVGSVVGIPANLAVANTYSAARRGAVQLHAVLRLCRHRHADAQRPDLHAAAPVEFGVAQGVVRSRNQ